MKNEFLVPLLQNFSTSPNNQIDPVEFRRRLVRKRAAKKEARRLQREAHKDVPMISSEPSLKAVSRDLREMSLSVFDSTPDPPREMSLSPVDRAWSASGSLSPVSAHESDDLPIDYKQGTSVSCSSPGRYVDPSTPPTDFLDSDWKEPEPRPDVLQSTTEMGPKLEFILSDDDDLATNYRTEICVPESPISKSCSTAPAARTSSLGKRPHDSTPTFTIKRTRSRSFLATQ